MKTCVALLLCIFFTTAAPAQTAAIQFDKENILYINEDNPLTIVAEGFSCKQLVVTSSNGTITGSNGHYIARPDHAEPYMRITVKAKTAKGIITVSEHPFRPKFLAVEKKD